MRVLYLIRHAKSDWENVEHHDFERPLNTRGRRNAQAMGSWLQQNIETPSLVLSSPANRALTTCFLITQQLGYAFADVLFRARLYESSPALALKIIQNVPSSNVSQMVFGHNEWISALAQSLCNVPLPPMVTCSVVALKFDVENWQNISKENVTLLFNHSPENLGFR